jgi:hypothetical protein
MAKVKKYELDIGKLIITSFLILCTYTLIISEDKKHNKLGIVLSLFDGALVYFGALNPSIKITEEN